VKGWWAVEIWKSTRLARLAAVTVAVGVAITLATPGVASAAAAPRNPTPNGSVNNPRPNVPDAHKMNPRPPSNSGPRDSDSGAGAPAPGPAPAPQPQRKDKPPDRDPHKFSPSQRTPAGQQQNNNRDNDNADDNQAQSPIQFPFPAPTPEPVQEPVPEPAPEPAPAPAPAPPGGAAGMLNGVGQIMTAAGTTVNNVLVSANNTMQWAAGQVAAALPTPEQLLPPGLTVVQQPPAPEPGYDTQEYHPGEEGTGTQFADYDLFERPPVIIGMPQRDLTTEVPGYQVQAQVGEGAYSGSWVYFCGPASAQNTLGILGITLTQDELADRLGTTDNGTDTIDQVKEGLNGVLADNAETPVYESGAVAGQGEYNPVTEKASASEQEVKEFRGNVVSSLTKGYPVVVNVGGTAPGVVINGQPHNYDGHYVTVVGYGENGDTVKVADSAYAPSYDENGTQTGWQSGTYEMKTADLANWSAGKSGYTYAKGWPAPGS
jgi:peptidase C39-like protein